MPTYSDDEVKGYLGGPPEKIVADLQKFSRSARVLSSDHPRLIDEYRGQWVAVYNEAVEANSKDFRDVLFELERKNIDLSDAILRFIDDRGPPLII